MSFVCDVIGSSHAQLFFFDRVECHTCPNALIPESAIDRSAHIFYHIIGKSITMLEYSNFTNCCSMHHDALGFFHFYRVFQLLLPPSQWYIFQVQRFLRFLIIILFILHVVPCRRAFCEFASRFWYATGG